MFFFFLLLFQEYSEVAFCRLLETRDGNDSRAGDGEVVSNSNKTVPKKQLILKVLEAQGDL